jgi:hypothetical protein
MDEQKNASVVEQKTARAYELRMVHHRIVCCRYAERKERYYWYERQYESVHPWRYSRRGSSQLPGSPVLYAESGIWLDDFLDAIKLALSCQSFHNNKVRHCLDILVSILCCCASKFLVLNRRDFLISLCSDSWRWATM